MKAIKSILFRLKILLPVGVILDVVDAIESKLLITYHNRRDIVIFEKGGRISSIYSRKSYADTVVVIDLDKYPRFDVDNYVKGTFKRIYSQ